MHPKTAVFLGVSAIGVLLDQLSKAWVVSSIALHHGEVPLIPGFLSLVHAQNPGAAMGLLRDFEYRQLLFGVFTAVATVVLLDLFRRLPKDDRFISLTLGLIFSGAIGNAIDRARQQYVTDFIRVYTDHPPLRAWLIETFGTYEWPSFNIADAALVVGVLMYLSHYLLVDEAEEASRAGLGHDAEDAGSAPDKEDTAAPTEPDEGAADARQQG